VSGTDIRRPWGQLSTAAEPSFAPSRELDFEMELGFWIGEGNRIGQRIPIAQASEAIFGYSLVNDWSARDIQRWEYQPLGPFLSKSFATSVSPFVITPEALAPFRVAARSRPEGEPQPLPYLHDPTDQVEGALDIQVETFCEGQCIAASNTRHLYWTPAQMVTHHASNGCSLRPGDLIASGTISGPEKEARGSLLEITRRGESPLKLADGRTRVFLEDGDEVVLSAWCHRQGLASIGFGQCQGRVLPSDGGLLRGV
jgi:fumarylacetoacetase